jgi:hypothetical protein
MYHSRFSMIFWGLSAPTIYDSTTRPAPADAATAPPGRVTAGRAATRRVTAGPVLWGSFVIDGGPLGRGRIKLEQKSSKQFALSSTVVYYGDTGLEGKVPPASIDAIRVVGPRQLPDTDLASVPGVLRWFVGPYGLHTPAALIHDRLIGLDPPIEGVTDQLADRYFRFMLRDLGVRFICRWLMWAAVACRTRYAAGGATRYLLGAWVALATIGIGTFLFGAVTGAVWLVVGAAVAPILLSALWYRQYGAGLVAAYFAVPWILPPTVFVLAFYGAFRFAEWVLYRLGTRARS